MLCPVRLNRCIRDTVGTLFYLAIEHHSYTLLSDHFPDVGNLKSLPLSRETIVIAKATISLSAPHSPAVISVAVPILAIVASSKSLSASKDFEI